MGLFDKLFQAAPEQTKLTQQEAFAGIAVAIAGADGSIASSEWDGIVNYIQRLRIYDNFSDQAFNKLFDKLFRIFEVARGGSAGESFRRGAFRRTPAYGICLCGRHITGRRRARRQRERHHQPAGVSIGHPREYGSVHHRGDADKKQGIARLSGNCTRQPPTVPAAAAPSRRQAKMAETIRNTKTSIPPALAGMDAAL